MIALNQIQNSLLLSLLFYLCISNTYSQHNKLTNDSLFVEIFIADGFDNEKINLYINENKILDGVYLMSSKIYGLTNQRIKIYSSRNKRRMIIETTDNPRKKYKKQKNNILIVEFDNHKNVMPLKIEKGKYFVIFKNRENNIYFEQFINQPGFD